MNTKSLRLKREYDRWMFPTSDNLCGWRRIVFGFLFNVTLGFYIIPNWDLLNNTGNFRLENINWIWTWVMSLGPWFPILALVPVMLLSNKPIQRWIAIILIPLPAFFAFFEWMQLLGVLYGPKGP